MAESDQCLYFLGDCHIIYLNDFDSGTLTSIVIKPILIKTLPEAKDLRMGNYLQLSFISLSKMEIGG